MKVNAVREATFLIGAFIGKLFVVYRVNNTRIGLALRLDVIEFQSTALADHSRPALAAPLIRPNNIGVIFAYPTRSLAFWAVRIH